MFTADGEIDCTKSNYNYYNYPDSFENNEEMSHIGETPFFYNKTNGLER